MAAETNTSRTQRKGKETDTTEQVTNY